MGCIKQGPVKTGLVYFAQALLHKTEDLVAGQSRQMVRLAGLPSMRPSPQATGR